jgi:hypothetical protein
VELQDYADDKVLALGTAAIPGKTGELRATWHTEAPKENTDVEMSEDQRRGDREEEE